jgi:hypothetical protein
VGSSLPRKPRPWFRFYVEAVRDRKLRRQPPAVRWLWVVVLAVARQSPVPGYLMLAEGAEITEEDLADEAAIKLADVKTGIQSFKDLEMLAWDENLRTWYVINWDERQFEGDHSRQGIPDALRQAVYARDNHECVECGSDQDLSLTHIDGEGDTEDNLQTMCRPCNARKGNRVRQQRYRKRHKAVTDNGNESVTGDGESRLPETETETELKPVSEPAPSKADLDASFDEFWKAYPRGRNNLSGGGGSRKKARDRWGKLTIDERNACLIAVGNYAAAQQKPDAPFTAHATTWLNEARWETWLEVPQDEPDAYEAVQL